MFDWGAQAVADILDCGLYGALQKIQNRPWLYDGLDKWLEKLEVKWAIIINTLHFHVVYKAVTMNIFTEDSAPLCSCICGQ